MFTSGICCGRPHELVLVLFSCQLNGVPLYQNVVALPHMCKLQDLNR